MPSYDAIESMPAETRAYFPPQPSRANISHMFRNAIVKGTYSHICYSDRYYRIHITGH